MRVALGVEQLLDDAPGGIGRYVAELATRLPDHDVEVVGFTARHPRRRVERAMHAYGLDATEPVILTLPRPVLYDAWHVAARVRARAEASGRSISCTHRRSRSRRATVFPSWSPRTTPRR